MSVLTPKRVFLVVVVFLLGAASAFANNPSPRYLARMVFDESTGNIVLFGGRADINVDGATGVIHSIDETWLLNGTRWSQRFPAVRPEARASHGMIYDSKRARVVLFGGFTDSSVINALPVFHNDTWSYKDGQWTILDTATAPKPRYDAAMAYDSDRDRIVLFGGIAYTADNKTTENLFDTWEFDGTNWTEVISNANGPKLEKGTLEYDPSRKQMLLVGINSDTAAAAMFIRNPETGAWVAPSPAPEKLPTCTNEGMMAYQKHQKKIAFVGGICSAANTTTPASDEVWEWDGGNWVKATTNSVDRVTGAAFTYDPTNFRMVMFGGVTYGSTFPRSTVQMYLNGTWSFNLITYRPRPRSISAFQTDAARGAMWLFGGLNEYGTGYSGDFWRNDGSNQWTPITVEGGGAPPTGCITPASAFDSTRSRFVLTCYGSEIFEWDGATWKAFADLSKEPASRRFSSMAYDEKLKKVILFGGYDDSTGNFRQDTWTWDGTTWAEVKNQRPPHRSLTSMWYDPNLQKVVIYGGVGRPNADSKAIRYQDMWSFDGNGWTQLNVTTTPGPRLGAQVAMNPVTKKLLLFGGLRAEQNEDNTTKQWYDSDTWEWNGAANTWTKLEPATTPDPRENGVMAWDPVRQMITMFGGFKGGYYLADVWTWNGTNWVPYLAPLSRSRATSR